VAYGIIEEGLAVKSFFDPSWVDLGVLGTYGRWAGVNVVWGVNLALFHATFSIGIPVLLVGLMFPGRVRERWVGGRGLWLPAALLVASFLLIFFVLNPYRPPLVPYLLAVLASAGLVLLAWRLPWPLPARGGDAGDPAPATARHPARARWFGLLGFLATLAFFVIHWAVPYTGLPATGAIILMGRPGGPRRLPRGEDGRGRGRGRRPARAAVVGAGGRGAGVLHPLRVSAGVEQDAAGKPGGHGPGSPGRGSPAGGHQVAPPAVTGGPGMAAYALALRSFLVMFVIGLGTVVFPLHFRALGFSVSYTGFLVGLASAGGALVSLLCGWAIERADRRRALLAGTVLVAAAYLLYTVTFSRGGLTGLRLAHGLVMPLMSVPAMVLISDVGGARRGRVAGMVNQWGAYGMIAGPVAGGALLEFAGAGSVFALSAAALVLGALIVFFAVPARVPGRGRDRVDAQAAATPGAPVVAPGPSAAPTGRALARNPRVLLLVAVNLLDFVAFQAWAFLLAVTLQTRGAPESLIGTMMTVNCLAYAVVQGVCGRLADAGRGMHAVAVGTFACGVAAILIPVAPLPLALGAVMVLLGAGSGPSFTGVYAGLSAEAGETMPRAMGILQASTGLGNALGPLLAGALGGLSMTAGFGAVLAAFWLESGLAGAYLAALQGGPRRKSPLASPLTPRRRSAS